MPDKSLVVGQYVWDGRRHGHVVAVNEANYRIRWENGSESWKPHGAVQPANVAEKQKLLSFLAETQKSYTEDYIKMFDHEDAWLIARGHYKARIAERLAQVYVRWNAGYAARNAHSIRVITQTGAENILEAWDTALWYADLEEVSE